MDDVIRTEDYKEHEIQIYYHTDSENPRTAWDNLGTIDHKSQYLIGDNEIQGDINDYIAGLLDIEEIYTWCERRGLEPYTDEATGALMDEFGKDNIWLPVYMYEHGNIALSTGSFACRWDSGQVGFIYVSKTKIREEYDWKNITKARIHLVEKYLKGEIETQSQWCNGEVYGYMVEGEDCDDSCWGYYGIEDMILEVKSVIDASIQHREKIDRQEARDRLLAQFRYLKGVIKAQVPTIYRKPFLLT